MIFFSTVNRNGISVDTVTLLLHTVRPLPGHADDILSDNRIINNNIIGYTETRIKPWDSTCEIIETLNLFNINFNNNENKLLSLAFGRRNDVVVLNEFYANGVSILSFKKHAFAERIFTLMLVYKKQSIHMQEFFQMFQYLLATHSIDIIAGYFNYDLLKVLQNKVLDIFRDYAQMVN